MATTATTKKSGTKFSTFKQQPSVACPFVQWSAATTCQVCFGARKSLRFEVLLICCWTLCGISFLACVIWQFSEHEASKFSWIKISVPSFCRPRSRLVIDMQLWFHCPVFAAQGHDLSLTSNVASWEVNFLVIQQSHASYCQKQSCCTYSLGCECQLCLLKQDLQNNQQNP